MRIEIPKNKELRLEKENQKYLLYIPIRIITRQGEKDYVLENLNVKGIYNKKEFQCTAIDIESNSVWKLKEYAFNDNEFIYEVRNIDLRKQGKIKFHLEFFFKQLGNFFIEIPYTIIGKTVLEEDKILIKQTQFFRRKQVITLTNLALILTLPIIFTFWSGLHTNVFDSQLSQPNITKILAFLAGFATFLGISKDFFVGLNLTKFLDRVFFNIELYYSNDLMKIVRNPITLFILLVFNTSLCFFTYNYYPINIPEIKDKMLIPYINEKALNNFDKVYWKDRKNIKWHCYDEKSTTENKTNINFAKNVEFGKYPPFFSSGKYQVKARKIVLVNYKTCQDAMKNQTIFTPEDFFNQTECEEVSKVLKDGNSDVISLLENGNIQIKSTRYKDKEVTSRELEKQLQRDYFDSFVKNNGNIRDSLILSLFKKEFQEETDEKVIIFNPEIYSPVIEKKLKELEDEALTQIDFFNNTSKVNYYINLLFLFRKMLIEDLTQVDTTNESLNNIYNLNKSIFLKINKKQNTLNRNQNQENLIQEILAFSLSINTPKFDEVVFNYVKEHLFSNKNNDKHSINLYCFEHIINALNIIERKDGLEVFLVKLINSFFKDTQVNKYHSPEYFKNNYFPLIGKLITIAHKHQASTLSLIDDYVYDYHENRLLEEKDKYNNVVLDNYAKELYSHSISNLNRKWKCIAYIISNKNKFFRVKKEVRFIIKNTT